tara:strand:+ start:27796 stop:28398 length:603 start_codon:yes stop_codon:yes gene_type:complete
MYDFFKRIFDFSMALIILLLSTPFFLLIMLFILIILGKPVFFCQYRPGLNNKPFKLFKFRTMNNYLDIDGSLLSDEKRLTSFGKFLRKTSIDELPSFVNVLKGELSLVGPRPLLMEYLSLYSNNQLRRHNVKPGITGWAQINGRNAIPWGKKFELDLWYIENRSFLLDLKIIFTTILKVFRKENITQKNHVSSKKFIGNG